METACFNQHQMLKCLIIVNNSQSRTSVINSDRQWGSLKEYQQYFKMYLYCALYAMYISIHEREAMDLQRDSTVTLIPEILSYKVTSFGNKSFFISSWSLVL